jgi:hypothetical protein
MIKLACNIAMYHPDERVLAARYRSWHVKPLLDQAAALVDRCILDYKHFSSYDYAWNEFQLDLRIKEKEVDLHRGSEAEEPPREEPPAAEEEEGAEPPEEAEESVEGEAAEEEEQPEQVEVPVLPPGAPISIELQSEAVQRKKELSSPGQPLALNEQRDATLKRLCRDYEEAVDRAWVAEQGLRKIYDHADLTSPLPTDAETLNESITNLAIWIRNAQEWLARYQQHEQAFTTVVSIRSLLGRTQWAVLKQSRESWGSRLRLPSDLFRGHDNCHLRGIGAWLAGEVGTVPWSMVIRLPDDALYERWGQSVEVDQSGRPACLLGRVENRRSPHPVEICGENTLINASPIGQQSAEGFWIIELYKPPGSISEAFSHLEDIILELRMVGIPQRTMS